MPDNLYIDTSGSVVPVAPQDEAGAQQLGWVPASPKQVADFQLEQQYGGALEGAKAFGEHAASALTLGASDVAERAAGVKPEAMAAREKFHPIASMAGTVAGVGAGLLIPGLDEVSAPALIAKAGKGVSGMLPATGLLSKAVAAGAGSAIEGAAYGAGQVVHEAALGDPNLTAQSALATVGLSAALGGALGGAGGALGHVLGDAAEHAPSWLKDTLADFEGERNLKVAGGTQSDITRLVKQKGRDNMRAIGREGRDLGLLGVLSSPETVGERAQGLLSKTGDEMQALLAKADAGGATRSMSDMLATARKDILAPLEKNPLQQDAASRLGSVLDGYAEKFAPAGGTATLTDLQAMRRQVSDALYGLRGNMDPFANSYKDALHDFRSMISNEINDGMDAAGIGKAEWKRLNRQYEVGRVFQDLADRGMNRAHGNNLVSPTEFIAGAASGPGAALGTAVARRYGSSMLGAAARALRNLAEPAVKVANATGDAIAAARAAGADTLTATAANAPEKVAALSLLERMNQRVTNKIETRVAALVRGSANVAREEVAAGIPRVFQLDNEAAQSVYQRRTSEIRKLASDPQQLQDRLSAQTDGWHEHAPDTAQALQITSARAVAFLASKLPAAGQTGPLAPKPTPSRADISKFNRYYEAVQKPTGILRAAAAGTLTKEQLEAVQTVYPELYAKMQQAAAVKLATAKAVPYRQKMMLSMLLGQDMDGTTSPYALMRNRMVLGKAMQAAAPKPAPSRADKLTMANRFLTPAQQSAQRGHR